MSDWTKERVNRLITDEMLIVGDELARQRNRSYEAWHAALMHLEELGKVADAVRNRQTMPDLKTPYLEFPERAN